MPLTEKERNQEHRKGEEWGAYKAKVDQMEETLEEIKGDVKQIRRESAQLYAIKMVEKIVFGLVSLVCIAVITALVKLVTK